MRNETIEPRSRVPLTLLLAGTLLAAAGGCGGEKSPAVAKMVPADASHAVIAGDLAALLAEWNAMAKRLYPLWREEAFPALGALIALSSEGKLEVNLFDPEDLKLHGIDPTAGFAVWFDNPENMTFVARYTDEAEAEKLVEGLLEDFGPKEKETAKGYRIKHYRGDYRGAAFAMVDGFVVGMTYFKMSGGEGPDLGDWAKRAFLVDEPLANVESYRANTNLLSGKNPALIYHFNPQAFFKAEGDHLERELKKLKEKGASLEGAPPEEGSALTSSVLLAKRAPYAPEPVADRPADPFGPPDYESPPDWDDPFAPSPERLKKKLERMEDLQDELEWLTGITVGLSIGKASWNLDLVVGLTPDAAASAKEAVPELGPDTGELRKEAIAFLRFALDGTVVLELIGDLASEEGDDAVGDLLRLADLPRRRDAYDGIIDEVGDYVSGTVEYILLQPPPPAELDDELHALRAVGVGLWMGGKAAEDIADLAEAAAEGSGLESRRSSEAGGVKLERFLTEVPRGLDSTMDLHITFGAEDEFGVVAVGEGVAEEALASVGPTATRKNDGVFLEFELHPGRIPLAGYKIDNWLAVAPLAMTYFGWLESWTIRGEMRDEGVVLRGELKFASQ